MKIVPKGKEAVKEETPFWILMGYSAQEWQLRRYFEHKGVQDWDLAPWEGMSLLGEDTDFN